MYIYTYIYIYIYTWVGMWVCIYVLLYYCLCTTGPVGPRGSFGGGKDSRRVRGEVQADRVGAQGEEGGGRRCKGVRWNRPFEWGLPRGHPGGEDGDGSRGHRSLLAVNKSRVRIPWGALDARVVRGGQFGWLHPVSLSGEDSCFVDSQEGPTTTGPISALIVVQWSKVPRANFGLPDRAGIRRTSVHVPKH